MDRKDNLDLKLFSSLEDLGFKAGLVSVKHLQEVRDTIEGSHKRGLIDEDLYCEYLSGFDFEVPNILSEARSIIVVATPVPALQVTFMRNGQPFQAIVRPLTTMIQINRYLIVLLMFSSPKNINLLQASYRRNF